MPDAAAQSATSLAGLFLSPRPKPAELQEACRSNGFADACRAAVMLSELARLPAPTDSLRAALSHVVEAVMASAAPDTALAAVHRLVCRSPRAAAWIDVLARSQRGAAILAIVGPFSRFLCDVLADDPDVLTGLLEPGVLDSPRGRAYFQSALRDEPVEAGDRGEALRVLRRFKRRELVRIAIRDLLRLAAFEEAVAEISDLACALLEATLRVCRRDLTRNHGSPQGRAGEAGFAIIGLGKLGGGELNYSSDVDVMFVHSEEGECAAPRGRPLARKALSNQEFFDRLAADVISAMQQPTEDGIVFRVDARLRPEGASGRLSRSLSACLAYYESWAEPWERQALIKASHAAGDEALSERFISSVQPFAYGKRLDALGLADVRAMRERIEPALETHSPHEFDVKLGPGGIRDVEFAVQALQLVAGAEDPSVRNANTLDALRALVERSHLDRDAGEALRDSYVFLRTLEHRLQLVNDRPERELPTDEERLEPIAHAMGYRTGADLLADFRAHTQRTRVIFDSLFRRLSSDASQTTREERLVVAPALPADEAAQVLRSHGISDPSAALQTLRRLATGPTHAHLSTKGQRQFAGLIPRILDAAAQCADPDLCIRNFARFVSILGCSNALYELLDRSEEPLSIMCRVAGSSPFLSDVLARHPEFLDALLDPEVMTDSKPGERLKDEAVQRLDDDAPLDSLRRFKRRELLRVGVRHLMGRDGVFAVMAAISDVADAVCHALLRFCEAQVLATHGEPLSPEGERIGFVLIALGKFGGRELHYSSDLDVTFIYGGEGETDGPEPVTAHQFFTKLAESMLRHSGELTAEGRLFAMDARLRAEGARGSIVMPLAGYVDYCYDRAHTWERLVLTRARHVAGDRELASHLLAEIHPFVYAGLTARELHSLRHIKQRIERERARPETEEQMDIKLGPGGISDVEFIVQKLQLQYGLQHEDICRPNTREAIEALARASILTEDDACTLSRAYEFLRAVECAVQIAHEEPAEGVDLRQPNLAALARRMSASGWCALNADSLRQRLRDECTAVRGVFARVFEE